MRKTAGICAVLLLSGCSLSTVALRTTARLVDRGRAAMLRESDPEVAREAMPAQLKLLEELLESDPANPHLLGSLAEGWSGYAYLFVQDGDPARAAGLYRRAAGFGLRLLARKAAFRWLGSMEAPALEAALAAAGRDDVRGLYWTATAWAGWAGVTTSDPEALAALEKATKVMERVRALDPGFEHGGPDLFFGVYYAARPRLAGGDPAKAKGYFDAALALAGRRYLQAQYMMMRYYAVATMDEDLFKKLGAEVAGADADALPDARLANEVAKRRAKTLLEKADDLF